MSTWFKSLREIFCVYCKNCVKFRALNQPSKITLCRHIISLEWKTVLKWTHLQHVSSKFPDHREDCFWNAMIKGLPGCQVLLSFRFYSLIRSPFRSLPFAQSAQHEILCFVNSPHAHFILANSKIMALHKNIRSPWICCPVFTIHACWTIFQSSCLICSRNFWNGDQSRLHFLDAVWGRVTLAEMITYHFRI